MAVEQATGWGEWIERAVEVSQQDQGPLVAAGIPAVNVGTLSTQGEASRRRHHTPDDVFQGFDPAAFQMAGATVEQAVTALDALPPPAPSGAEDAAPAFTFSPGAPARDPARRISSSARPATSLAASSRRCSCFCCCR